MNHFTNVYKSFDLSRYDYCDSDLKGLVISFFARIKTHMDAGHTVQTLQAAQDLVAYEVQVSWHEEKYVRLINLSYIFLTKSFTQENTNR